MKQIRALIVEDEPLARAALRRHLASDKEVVIVGECGDGLTALKAIRQHRPDLVFLDVGLPGLSGLDLLNELNGEMPPAVIFVTAHARYAIPAFAAAATDFLLKPFTRERFRKSLQRARLRLNSKSLSRRRLATLVENARAEARPSVLTLKVGRRFVLVRAEEIESISASRSHAVLQTPDGRLRTRVSLPSLEKKLPPGLFVRVNRSTLINDRLIREIVRKTHGDGVVRMASGREFPLSRRWRAHWSPLTAEHGAANLPPAK